MNSNGTIATYLSESSILPLDMAQGKESLAESLGLMMSYAIEKRDKSLFLKNYKVFKKYYLTSEGLIYWKLQPNGKSNVTTNALIDDTRIIDSLIEAERLWGISESGEIAKKSSLFISSNLIKDGLLTDFYDLKYKVSYHQITLSYLNPEPLRKMVQNNYISKEVYNNNLQLIKKTPNDGIFYAQAYDIPEKKYVYATKVNLVDQLLVALNKSYAGEPTTDLYNFIHEQFNKEGKLYGQFDRTTRLASVNYESPAVYGLAILYCLEIGKNDTAQDMYNRMIEFRIIEGEYTGGYISKDNTHIFDNLYPMLAEIKLYKQGLIK
jgi:hypothetical protein